VIAGEDLTREEAAGILENIIAGSLSEIQAGAFLTALRMKSESTEEILGFLDTMENHMVKVTLADPYAIDMCGTGGDGSHTFNISTTAAIIVAAGGVTVAKHGNRSISSKCGSADVLEALGVKVDLPAEIVKKSADQIGIGFFFAPMYHPAMKILAPVRKNLQIRTVFNMLGPLLNPAGVRRQLIGAFSLSTANKLALVLAARNYQKACTVYSADGMDEISPYAENFLFELIPGNSGLKRNSFHYKGKNATGPASDIKGNSPQENARITLDVLDGNRIAAREISIINAAFGFYVGDKVKTVEEGIQLAGEVIDSGSARNKMEEMIQFSRDFASEKI
jgi:anthranilate phosphoribosyltransferase